MPQFEFLADQGILARCGDETEALAWANSLRGQTPGWMVDLVQAYTTVAVFIDPQVISLRQALDQLEGIPWNRAVGPSGRLHRIPCCYERGPDMDRVVAHTGLKADEVIRLHTGTEYTIHAIGFSPGFPYLGYLPAALSGVPRLQTPRIRVEAGSVGLTGRQTGIYPEARPGGWNLIGQTPLILVDVPNNYFPLRTGDRIRFEPISEERFLQLQGKRLPTD